MIEKIFRVLVRLLTPLIFLIIFPACTFQSDLDSRPVRVGLVTNSHNGLRNVQGFKDGMTALGYVEGENISYIFAESPTGLEQLEPTIKAMVEENVDLIFTAGTPTGIAAHRVTAGTEIPVVFGVIADPTEAGVITDLTRPGGNMTGVMLSKNQGRRLELLLEIAPDIKRILVPFDPTDPASTSAVDQISRLAPSLNVEIVEGHAEDQDSVTRILKNFPEDVDAIFLVPGTTVNARLNEIVALAKAQKLPLSGPSTAQVEEGALMTYGFVHHEAGSQAARIADQILKGTAPGVIPVEIAEFFLAINLPAAQAIGLDIPDSLLQRAEIVIRDDGAKSP